jgi:RND family efflux transporter MFP subunit
MKKRLILLMLFMTSLLVLVACGEKEVTEKDEVRPVRAMTLSDPEPFSGRWFPGKATATQKANLSFRVPGTVEVIPVDIGDNVKKGALLARLDPKDYQVALNDARAQLKKARAGLDLAESEYARVARVYEKDPGAVSKSMVDVRKAELDTAKAQVVSARASVESAEDNLGYSYLKSPYDGAVVEKFVEQFEDVQAKQEIIRVLDTRQIEFTVQVPETLMKSIDIVRSVGGADVVFDTHPEVRVKAKIKEVGKEASKTTRTYPVTLIMDQPEDFQILPGMTGKATSDKEATVVIAKDDGMVGNEIPITATFSDDAEHSYVWVIDQGSLQVAKRKVQVLTMTENGTLVTGLEVGEMIATAGVNLLIEGQKVRILE